MRQAYQRDKVGAYVSVATLLGVYNTKTDIKRRIMFRNYSPGQYKTVNINNK